MSEEKAVYVVGLYPEHWERAMTGLCRLRDLAEDLDHPLIEVRILPAIASACEEADRYRRACLEERSTR